MINLANFQNRGVVLTTTHIRNLSNGDEYELKLMNVTQLLLVKIKKDSKGKFVPSQSYSISSTDVAPYSSSSAQDTEDGAMDEIFNNSLAFFDPNKSYTIQNNPAY